MGRAKIAGEVIRKSEVAEMPDHRTVLTCGEVWVYRTMAAKGKLGVTCADFNGADLRHYIRNLKNKVIGIDEEWEADAFSRHKRWRLKDGHSFREIPYPKKKKLASAQTGPALNQNVCNGELQGGFDV